MMVTDAFSTAAAQAVTMIARQPSVTDSQPPVVFSCSINAYDIVQQTLSINGNKSAKNPRVVSSPLLAM